MSTMPDVNSQLKLLKIFTARQPSVARQWKKHISGSSAIKDFITLIVKRLFLCLRKVVDRVTENKYFLYSGRILVS